MLDLQKSHLVPHHHQHPISLLTFQLESSLAISKNSHHGVSSFKVDHYTIDNLPREILLNILLMDFSPSDLHSFSRISKSIREVV